MRVKDITFIAIRLLAFYLTIEAVAVLPSSIAMVLVPISNSPDTAMNGTLAMGGLVSGLALVLFGGLLWTCANGLANFMTKGLRDEPAGKEEINLQSMTRAGITAIGVYVIVTTIPGAVNALNTLSSNSSEKVNAISPLIQIIIGITCAFNSKFVVSKLQGSSE
jgi:hypothetical protein